MLPIQPNISTDSAESSTSSNEVDLLLVLRAAACFWVVVTHCNPPRNAIMFGKTDWSWIIPTHGGTGLWVFFCLSGYLMGKAFYSGRYTYNWKGILNFWRNRILRILPLYGFAILTLSLFVYPEIFQPENWHSFIRMFTFTWQSSRAINFNGVIWSLSVEMQFYLVVPFIYGFLRSRILKLSQCWIAIFTVLLANFAVRWIAQRYLISLPEPDRGYAALDWYMASLNQLDIFMVGFLMNPLLVAMNQAKITFLKQLSPQTCTWIAISLISVLGGAISYFIYPSSPLVAFPDLFLFVNSFVLQPLTAIVVAIFIFLVEYHRWKTPNCSLSRNAIAQNPVRVLEVFGNLSYGVYLWHYPIFVKIGSLFTSSTPLATFFLRLLVVSCLSVLLATVTYYAIELPAARWKTYRSLAKSPVAS